VRCLAYPITLTNGFDALQGLQQIPTKKFAMTICRVNDNIHRHALQYYICYLQ
jgi:hypothetical protein